MKLYLIRHAEPVTTGVYLGCKNDPPLKAAPPALGIEVPIVYVSPLLRARETAEAIDAPKVVIDDLREIDFGEWSGRPHEEVRRIWNLPDGNWFGMDPPGGERWGDFVSRVQGALATILKDRRYKAIVAHGAVNSVIAAALGTPNATKFKQKYAEIREFDLSA